jgi:hypothetical protein
MKLNRIAWLLVIALAVLAVPVTKAQTPKIAMTVTVLDGGQPYPVPIPPVR